MLTHARVESLRLWAKGSQGNEDEDEVQYVGPARVGMLILRALLNR